MNLKQLKYNREHSCRIKDGFYKNLEEIGTENRLNKRAENSFHGIDGAKVVEGADGRLRVSYKKKSVDFEKMQDFLYDEFKKYCDKNYDYFMKFGGELPNFEVWCEYFAKNLLQMAITNWKD